jgi:hypothetical protein
MAEFWHPTRRRQGIEIVDDGAVPITRLELKKHLEAVRKDIHSLAEKDRA